MKKSKISITADNKLVLTDIYENEIKFISPGNLSSKGSQKTHIETTSGEKQLRKLVLEGKWSLSEGHDLQLNILGANSPYFGKTIIFRGNIEPPTGNKLGFRIRRSENISGLRATSIQLTGRWQADSNNRLSFRAAKSRGKYDILRIEGGWRVNKRNELLYRYSETALRTKTNKKITIIFKGHWDINKNRLIYRMDGYPGSFFNFHAGIRSRSLIASDGLIKFAVGIKYSEKKTYHTLKRIITLYGTWKFEKNFSIGFELKYPSKDRYKIVFNIKEILSKGGSLTVSTEGPGNKGLKVTFQKTFNNDAELFIGLSKIASEKRLTAGVRIKF